jgi:hypothetical protein
MQLDDAQRAAFDRDRFLIFPGLFTRAEIDALVKECDRLSGIDAEYINASAAARCARSSACTRATVRRHRRNSARRRAPRACSVRRLS